MTKFFVNPENKVDNQINITGSDVNHIKNVLRLSVGKAILINDRQGHDYKCIISKIETDKVITQIIETHFNETEPSIQTILFQSILKGEKMDFAIQKCIEIGVTSIVPMITQRCVIKLDAESKWMKKVERWQKIAESAAKQSKRGIVPEIAQVMSFNSVLKDLKKHEVKYCIPYENEKTCHIKTYLQSLTNVTAIGIFIGPEGGFTQEEVQQAINQGVTPISLGRRILRSETAGMVTLANIMYEMGDEVL